MSNGIEIQVLSERRYKAGYVVRRELWSHGSTDEPTPMRSAYNEQGDYIGNPRFAHRLTARYGIRPEKAHPEHSVCSIGFSERDQKWYGWSHRAIFGFGIGHTVKPGTIGFEPSNREEFAERHRQFWGDLSGYTVAETDDGVVVSSPGGDDGATLSSVYPWPERWGRGEWTAETLEDARQMAMAFAAEIS